LEKNVMQGFRITILLLLTWVLPLPYSIEGAQREEATAQVDGVASVSYNEAKDETNVGFSNLRIFGSGDTIIALSLGCSYKGRERAEPDQCFVGLTSRSPHQQFPNHNIPFKATADGKVATEKPFKSFGFQREQELYIEPLFGLWTLREIRALANGREVVFKIGKRKIQLEEKQVEAIRFVARHFGK
jgi:hypothetical protein